MTVTGAKLIINAKGWSKVQRICEAVVVGAGIIRFPEGLPTPFYLDVQMEFKRVQHHAYAKTALHAVCPALVIIPEFVDILVISPALTAPLPLAQHLSRLDKLGGERPPWQSLCCHWD